MTCPLDGGKLKVADDETKVECGGTFDEGASFRMPCSNCFPISSGDVPRGKWFTSEPTEEEAAEMENEAKGDEEETGEDSPLGKLMAAAASLEFDMSSGSGKKQAAQDLLDLLLEFDGTKVDLPSDDKKCFREIGALISSDASISPSEAMKLVVEKYGFADKKAGKAAKKEAAVKNACAEPSNGPLLMAFAELSEIYFKEGNTNAGISYQKVL